MSRRLALAGTMVALAIPSVARGDEAEAATLAAARKAVVAGDFPAARAAAQAVFTGESSSADRAAAAELLFVVDVWSASGKPPANGARLAPIDLSDWQAAFAVARDRLIAGAYDDAAGGFDRLAAVAPDPVAAARATVLRDLARDASAARPTPAPPPQTSVHVVSDEGVHAQPTKETRWYGWQTLLIDAGTIAITPFVPPVGIGTYLLGPPLVHAFHGRPVVAVADFGLRLTVPPTGAVIGYAVASGCTGFLCELEGAAVGLLIGIGVAMTIDAALLSRETVKVDKPKQVTIVPIVTPNKLGVGGTF